MKCKDCENLWKSNYVDGGYGCKLMNLRTFKWDGGIPKTSPKWCPLKVIEDEKIKEHTERLVRKIGI